MNASGISDISDSVIYKDQCPFTNTLSRKLLYCNVKFDMLILINSVYLWFSLLRGLLLERPDDVIWLKTIYVSILLCSGCFYLIDAHFRQSDAMCLGVFDCHQWYGSNYIPTSVCTYHKCWLSKPAAITLKWLCFNHFPNKMSPLFSKPTTICWSIHDFIMLTSGIYIGGNLAQ